MPSAAIVDEPVAMELAGTSVESLATETEGDVVAVKETAEEALNLVVDVVAAAVVRKASFHWYCLHWRI